MKKNEPRRAIALGHGAADPAAAPGRIRRSHVRSIMTKEEHLHDPIPFIIRDIGGSGSEAPRLT